MTYLVSVYDEDLASGGPEEGGWWYERGTLARTVLVTRSEAKAYDYSRRLNKKLHNFTWGPNAGRREKSSVLSDGEFVACVHEEHAPLSYPETRPHYE